MRDSAGSRLSVIVEVGPFVARVLSRDRGGCRTWNEEDLTPFDRGVGSCGGGEVGIGIVAFGASGVGARVVFTRSFAGSTGNELFDLAAANRTRCVREAV